MKLNLYFMRDDFPELRLQGAISHSRSRACLSYALAVETLPASPEKDILYIVRAKDLPDDPPHATVWNLLCIGKPESAWLSGDQNVLYTEESITPVNLVNCVTKSFRRYNRWEEELLSAIEEPAPLDKLGERSVALIENPIIAQSTSYEPFFYAVPVPKVSDSTIYPVYLDEVYGSHLAEGHLAVPGKAAMAFNQNQEFADLEKEHEPTLFTGAPWSDLSEHRLSFQSLLFNCRVRGAPVARVIVDEVAHPLRDKDYVLIQVIGSCLLKILEQSRMGDTDQNIRFAEICRDLILGNPVSDERMAPLMGNLGWNVSDSYLCAVFSEQNANRSFRAIAQVALAASARSGHRRHFLFKEHAIVIANLTKGSADREKVIEEMLHRIDGMDAIASFSASFAGFEKLGVFYRQAAAVERLGLAHAPERCAYRYEDYATPYLIEICARSPLGETIIPDSLKKLIASDKAKKTDDVALLRAYLDNDRNVARTIRELFMHRNTFLYRLEKIKATLGVDLNDPDTRLALQVALRILNGHHANSI